MTKKKLAKYRNQLQKLSARLRGDIATLEDEARVPTSGQAAGNLSNAPMHLGDMGTEVYLQELNATLLENEGYLRTEVLAALERIERGTYGICENCGRKIVEERLDLIPYTRYCTPCAGQLQAGKPVNLNEGRPRDSAGEFNVYDERVEERIKGADFSQEVESTSSGRRGRPKWSHEDIHAAGTAGGGTAEGGLAGTNIGAGDPDNADLEEALGSGVHDVAIEEDEEEALPYAGPGGGAVGGTPAGKRTVGGKEHQHRGLAPQPGPGEPAAS